MLARSSYLISYQYYREERLRNPLDKHAVIRRNKKDFHCSRQFCNPLLKYLRRDGFFSKTKENNVFETIKGHFQIHITGEHVQEGLEREQGHCNYRPCHLQNSSCIHTLNAVVAATTTSLPPSYLEKQPGRQGDGGNTLSWSPPPTYSSNTLSFVSVVLFLDKYAPLPPPSGGPGGEGRLEERYHWSDPLPAHSH